MPTGNTEPGGDRDAHSERAHNRARGGQARFTRTTDTAHRDAEACDLRSKGWTYRQIGEHFGIPTRTAWDAVHAGLQAIVKEPAEAALQFELDRLDAELRRLNDLEDAARTVLDRNHVTVANNGQIVHHDGEPLLDDAPVLQAIDRLLKIEEQRRRNGESRRKLLGMDAPSRVSVEAEQLGREIGKLLDAALGPDEDTSVDPDA